MTSDMIAPFADEVQNTPEIIFYSGIPAISDSKQEMGFNEELFIQNVERLVCAKVNEINFENADGKRYYANVTPAELDTTSRRAPRNLARRWCYFILRHHPKTELSFPQIGSRYHRNHTSVINGYSNTLEDIRSWRTTRHVQILKEICDVFGFKQFGIDIINLAHNAPQYHKKQSYKPRAPRGGKQKTERNSAIVSEYHDAGDSMQVIADRHEISRARVGQIIDDYGNGARPQSEAMKLAFATGRHKSPPSMREEQFPERNDKIMALVDVGYSHDEVAERLNISSNVVAGVVFRRKNKAGAA